MFNPKDYSDNFIIEKDHSDYVLKKYIGNIHGTLEIPEGVTRISSFAFGPSWTNNYPEINKIIFPRTLKRIPDCNFGSWANLEEVIIPEGVTSIADSAFFDNKIKKVRLPSTLDRIGKDTFGLCKNLTEIVLNHLSPSIFANLMHEGYAVAETIYSKDPAVKPELQFKIYIGDSKDIELSKYFKHFSINYKNAKFELKQLFIMYGNYVVGYLGHDIDLIIPESSIGVAPWAFAYNKNIKSVVFSKKTKSIGYSAFEGCSALNNIALNDSLETIGDESFMGTSITEVTIPKKVTYVGSYAFAYCHSLKSLTIVKKRTYDYREDEWHSDWKAHLECVPKYQYI